MFTGLRRKRLRRSGAFIVADVTDAWFDDVGGFGVRETELRVISVVKGEPSGSTIRFRHYTGLHGNTLYPYEPPHYELEVSRAYLIFGSKADDGAYRQLDKTQFDDPTQGTLLAADDRPHRGSTASEAARFELEGLLASQVCADVVYAIRKLDAMSTWDKPGRLDFNRAAALEAIRPFVLSADETIAEAAIRVLDPGR